MVQRTTGAHIDTNETVAPDVKHLRSVCAPGTQTLCAAAMSGKPTQIDTKMTGSPPPLRVRDAATMVWAPRSVFRRMVDVSTYGWTLTWLVLLTTVLGFFTIQTGLIDRDVDQATEQRLSRLELDQTDLISRSELSERMQDVREEGEFWKFMARTQALLFSPAHLVASILLIASVLYATVALSGRKPEYHTLVSICVYASVVELIGMALRVAMMMFYRTMAVDTSLALLVPAGDSPTPLRAVLGGIDPFEIWFWYLVRTGLVTTWQLGRGWSAVVCVLLFVFCCILRIAPLLMAAQGGMQGVS